MPTVIAQSAADLLLGPFAVGVVLGALGTAGLGLLLWGRRRRLQPAAGVGPAADPRLAPVELPDGLPACTAVLAADDRLLQACLAGFVARTPGAALLTANPVLPAAATVERLLRRHAGREMDRLPALIDGLGLAEVLDRRPDTLDRVPAWRVALAVELLGEPRQLAAALPSDVGARARAGLLACLRWLRAARDLRIVYGVGSSADLEDLADALVVVDEQARVYGPGDPWQLLGATLRDPLSERFEVVSTLRAEVDYLDEEGRWLRVLACGGREVHLPFQRLSPGWRGRIAVRPDAVLLVREPLPGPRLTNQIHGVIREIGDLLGRSLVAVDVGGGELLRALVEPDTVRGLGLGIGTEVVCVFEPGAVRWAGSVPARGVGSVVSAGIRS